MVEGYIDFDGMVLKNWDFSVMCVIIVVKLLVFYGVFFEWLIVFGRGFYVLVVFNDMWVGKGLNCCIEIIFLL